MLRPKLFLFKHKLSHTHFSLARHIVRLKKLLVATLCGSIAALGFSASAAAQQSIWPGTTVPAAIDNGASGPLELGISFKSDVSGSISGIRFYKSALNTGTHVGHLWSSTGTLLASVTFTGETASGWQQANFSNPVTIAANTVYVASYGLPVGHFSANWNYFLSAGTNNPPLHALQTPDGVYGTFGSFPRYTHQAANYWVDVVFKNAAATKPAITLQPASKTVTVGQAAAFSVTATGTAPMTYEWRKNGTPVSGATSSSYTTPATTTADSGAQYTAVISNAAGSATSSTATLTVAAATLALSVTPTTLSFGNVDTSTIDTLPVVLKNTGTGNVTFAPTVTGSVTGSVVVASNATNSPSTVSASGTGVHSSFTAWVAPSMVRVGKTTAAGTLSSMSLSGARGETVDSQVVVQGPAGGLTNVNVSATALAGPNGVSIPAANITLYREYYLSVTGTASYGGGSNPPLGSGTYPEPLIPFKDPETGAALCSSSASLKACNATISSGQNQPYWIDISIPHGSTVTPPGTYSGNISVTSDQGSATVPVTVTVWNFELPMQASEATLWTLWSPAAGNTTTTLARALMRNKVMGWYDPSANASADVTNMGLNRSGLDSYYYIGIQCNGAYSSIPTTSQINTAAANFPAGLGLDFYMADELNGCTGDYTPIKTLAANAHAANRSVKTMLTLDAVDPNLNGSVDHWVLLNSVQKWPTLPFTGGGDLWSYTSCNAGYGNAPEWMMDYPPINERMQAGFLNFTQGATGLLYYRADGWTAGNAIGSWNNVDTTACGGGLGRPGDGIFVYPPAPIASTESAPGIRLKAIRDGIQDYEYAHILKNLGQLNVVNTNLLPIAGSWSNWSHDPNALESARQQLGQLLHQLAP